MDKQKLRFRIYKSHQSDGTWTYSILFQVFLSSDHRCVQLKSLTITCSLKLKSLDDVTNNKPEKFTQTIDPNGVYATDVDR